ncbi:MAG: polysaccharide lyase [Chitinispirillaceae bacterium]
MVKQLATVLAAAAPVLAGSIGGEPAQIESDLASRGDIVFFGGFEKTEEGALCTDEWKKDWGIAFTSRCEEAQQITSAVPGAGKYALRVGYPKGGVGPGETGMQFPVDFSRIDSMPVKQFDSLYLRYYVKFEDNFDFRKGGKLPGLMGGNESWKRSGGDQPDGTNGWTLRFMWRTGGKAVVYSYLPPGTYGGEQWGLDIDLNTTFSTGKWHCIEQYVGINDVGKENGQLYVWIDGKQVLELDDVLYRTVDNDAGRIGGFYFSTFHGGNTPDWGPKNDSYAQFDGFVVAKERVGAWE